MHIHKPKAVASIPEFVRELAVITAGILIALGLEQAIEAVHRHHEAAVLERSLRSELAVDVGVAAEKAALDRCVRGRVADLTAKMAKAGTAWTADRFMRADGRSDDQIEVIHSPFRPVVRSAWQAAQASPALHEMAEDRRENYAVLYDAIEVLESTQNTQATLEADIGSLAYDTPLTPPMRAAYLDRLSQLDGAYHLTTLVAHGVLRRARTLDLRTDSHGLEQKLKTQRAVWGACVEDVAAGPTD